MVKCSHQLSKLISLNASHHAFNSFKSTEWKRVGSYTPRGGDYIPPTIHNSREHNKGTETEHIIHRVEVGMLSPISETETLCHNLDESMIPVTAETRIHHP